ILDSRCYMKEERIFDNIVYDQIGQDLRYTFQVTRGMLSSNPQRLFHQNLRMYTWVCASIQFSTISRDPVLIFLNHIVRIHIEYSLFRMDVLMKYLQSGYSQN